MFQETEVAIPAKLYVIPLLFILIVYIVHSFYVWIFSDSKEDFDRADDNNQTIICKGLLKSYVLEPNKYEIYGENISTRILFIRRVFDMSDCEVAVKKK